MAGETPPAGGGGFSRKVAGAPLWVWAVGGGAVLGLVWMVVRRNKSTAGSQAAASDTTSTGDQTNPTTILGPSDYGRGGLSEAQFEQLLAAIQSLQGPTSTPPVISTQPQPIDKPPWWDTRPTPTGGINWGRPIYNGEPPAVQTTAFYGMPNALYSPN